MILIVFDFSRVEGRLQSKLREIRSQDGFEHFLLPAWDEELSGLADDDSYVVVVNVSQLRCDAFVKKDGHSTVVPLPDLHLGGLETKEEQFQEAIVNQRRHRKRQGTLC